MNPVYISAGHYYTIPEVAEAHDVTRRSVIVWLQRGWIKGVKTGIGWLIEADSVKGFTPPKPGPRKATYDT